MSHIICWVLPTLGIASSTVFSEMDPFLFYFLRIIVDHSVFVFVRGVFAKSGVCVRVPHHVGHFLSIFGCVYDYRGSTFVCREYDDRVVFIQCLYSNPLCLADVRLREFNSFDGTYNLPSEFFCRVLCHVFRDYLSTGYDFFDWEGSRSNGKVLTFTNYRSFIITDLPIAQVHYPPVCVYVGVCHFFLTLRCVVKSFELALLS